MRVLYICNEYPPAVHGGIGVFVRTLAEQLAAAGHEVAVIGFATHVRACARALENGVHVVRLPWPRGRGALRLGRFRIDSTALAARKTLSREAARLAAEFQPDVVESHDWSGPLWTPPWRPWIVRLHGASSVHAWPRENRGKRLLRFFERRNLRTADAIVAPSRFIARATLDAMRLAGKPAQIIPHGVDCERFRPYDGPRDPSEVLFAATVKKQKGIEELFRAIPRIVAGFPEARFTIAGRCVEDQGAPCSPRALIERLGRELPYERRSAADRVRFLGHVPQAELAELYRRAAVTVFPSHAESFGLACAEAMACGSAVVMTARGSGPELVENGKSGLLAEPADIPAIASAVVTLLQDAGLRQRLGTAARARVLETFHIRDATARNAAFYQQVAARFPSRQGIHA